MSKTNPIRTLAATAQTAMEKAVAEGVVRMIGDQIFEHLASKTATFENALSGAMALVFYDGRNNHVIKAVGSDETREGCYAIDLADLICLGAKSAQRMRLRCLKVLLVDGQMHKFGLDGNPRGRVIEEALRDTA